MPTTSSWMEQADTLPTLTDHPLHALRTYIGLCTCPAGPCTGGVYCARPHPVLVMLLLWTVKLASAGQHAESRCVFRTITGRRQCRANTASV